MYALLLTEKLNRFDEARKLLLSAVNRWSELIAKGTDSTGTWAVPGLLLSIMEVITTKIDTEMNPMVQGWLNAERGT
jgi:hypothetical protein